VLKVVPEMSLRAEALTFVSLNVEDQSMPSSLNLHIKDWGMLTAVNTQTPKNV